MKAHAKSSPCDLPGVRSPAQSIQLPRGAHVRISGDPAGVPLSRLVVTASQDKGWHTGLLTSAHPVPSPSHTAAPSDH